MIFFLLLLGVVAIVKLQPLRIKHITVKLDQVDCVDAATLSDFLNRQKLSLLQIDSTKIIDLTLKQYPCIRKLVIGWKFPNTIFVSGSGRIAIAKVATYDATEDKIHLQLQDSSPSSQAAMLDWNIATPSGKEFLVDQDGVIFAMDGNLVLPKIYLPQQKLEIGTSLDKKVFQSLAELFVALDKINIQPAGLTGKVVGDDLLLRDDIDLVFSLDNDILRQVASLQLISEKAKIDSKNIKIVDLRFDKPVVVFR